MNPRDSRKGQQIADANAAKGDNIFSRTFNSLFPGVGKYTKERAKKKDQAEWNARLAAKKLEQRRQKRLQEVETNETYREWHTD